MCGIVGYIGHREAVPDILKGLKALEYRGYDSAGLAVLSHEEGKVKCVRSVGRVSALESKLRENKDLSGTIGIAHTRWATHGAPTLKNTHPHFDRKREIFVVHNGIIENYREIREILEREGHKFTSETDTEVVVHLMRSFLDDGHTHKEAFLKTLSMIKGAYGLALMIRSDPETIYVARHSSPLVIGKGEGENFIASDPSALVHKTGNVIYLKDGEVAEVGREDIRITDLSDVPAEHEVVELERDLKQVQKGKFEHFMLKEINEGADVIRSACRGRLRVKDKAVNFGGLRDVRNELLKIKRIIIVSCGTSYYAGLAGKYIFEEIAGIPTEVEQASEFRYRKRAFIPQTAVLAISQSGETADTLAAVRVAKDSGILTLGLVNVVGSTIARETDAGVYNHAGPEISVASTKAYLSQITILTLMSCYLSERRDQEVLDLMEAIDSLPKKIEEVLSRSKDLEVLADKYHKYDNFFYIGRKYGYPTALEGALKLKEISYIHAEGYSAGEMKHGPIALVDGNFPTLAICLNNGVFEKMRSNIEEIKARKGPVLVLSNEGEGGMNDLADDVFHIPRVPEPLEPILSMVPLQLFAYYIGVKRGVDVDRPRNLAKSVTVE